jgi:S-adenosylmethionine hydrolase
MKTMVNLPWPDVVVKKGSITGEVVYIDRFGNLITNIPNAEVGPFYESRATACFKRATQIPLRSFYGQVPAGKPLAVQGSSGLLEISINGGDAAEVLNAGIGDSVIIK